MLLAEVISGRKNIIFEDYLKCTSVFVCELFENANVLLCRDYSVIIIDYFSVV